MPVHDAVTEAAKKAHWWFVLLLCSSVGLMLAGMGFASYFGAFAKADTVAKHETRIDKLEQQRDGEMEWRRYLAEQVGQIAVRVGAPTSPPPAISVDQPRGMK